MMMSLKQFAQLLVALFLFNSLALANDLMGPRPKHEMPFVMPKPPFVQAKSYLLIDVNSGKIIAQHQKDKRHPPASLTKMLVTYLITKALDENRLHIDTTVKVSKKAWRMKGSSMFLKEGQRVSIRELLKGIIVQSGNDACIALAEHISGSVDVFVEEMNALAQHMGMSGSHFVNTSGYPAKNHYSTAHDIALLSRAIILDYPEYYSWYQQKSYTFNKIKQRNRNRLLWKDASFDGLKTGHSEEAGYCLAASAQRNGMRLLVVVMGAPSTSARTAAGKKLIDYGFKYYQTHTLYQEDQKIKEVRVWKGDKKYLPIGTQQEVLVTIPKSRYKDLSAHVELDETLIAPVRKYQTVGKLVIELDDKEIRTIPLVSLSRSTSGGFVHNLLDSITMKVSSWFG